ncbi:MAG: ATP-binding protein [Coriobacteriales bacterium]|jgi:predicted AAA+ superfamily ATPase|nr:ATP-binding protein [Coriobacteriales bacterium]
MDKTIAEIISSFSLEDYRPIFKRDLSLGNLSEPRRGNLVTVVTGIRRSGKTYRLFQEIDQLIDKANARPSVLYFNFEDDRLKPFTPDLGNRVLETFYLLNPSARITGAYLFLDEIQVVPEWDIWLRRVVDTEKVTVCVTGSSAKLLSKDIATAFRGRALSYEMTPLSFSEFARLPHEGVPCKDGAGLLEDSASNRAFSQKEHSLLASLFLGYLDKGGFPAVQALSAKQATSLLQDYVSRVVATDVVERHGIGNLKAADLFAQRAVSNNARELSIRKSENVFKSLGIAVSRAFLADLLDYLADSFLIQTVLPFSRALADNARSAVKVYAVDPGIVRAVSPSSATDVGQRLECVVYAELRRRCSPMHSGAVASYRTNSGYEVDFIVGDMLSQTGFAFYQVCESLGDGRVRKRELRAISEAMGEKGIGTGTIITLDDEETIDLVLQNGHLARIEVIPAWKWCLV